MNVLQYDNLNWKHLTGGDEFDYPISYWGAVLSVRDDGHADLLYRWAPDSYCHFHRHVCAISSVVLAGELHITDFVDGKPTETRVRKAGHFSQSSDQHVHMERGGPEGALVLFNLYAPDDRLVEQLADDGSVITTRTLSALLAANR